MCSEAAEKWYSFTEGPSERGGPIPSRPARNYGYIHSPPPTSAQLLLLLREGIWREGNEDRGETIIYLHNVGVGSGRVGANCEGDTWGEREREEEGEGTLDSRNVTQHLSPPISEAKPSGFQSKKQ